MIIILHCRVEKKVEEKKVYDWKKSVKKGEKKEPVEEPNPEKVQLKKPKVIEKPKEEEVDALDGGMNMFGGGGGGGDY